MKNSEASALRPGVYEIRDASGRVYIGSSVLPARRWRQHKCDLRKNRHHSPALQAVANKHGIGSLKFSVIENVPAVMLQDREQALLDRNKPELNCIYEAGPGRMHRDPVYRSNLKAALAAANLRPEYRQNRRLANQQKRAVICEGNDRQFESCADAARHYGVSSGSVSASASNLTHKTLGGLSFCFVGDEGVPKRPRSEIRRVVVNVDTCVRFGSVVAAAKSIGVTRAAIKFAVKHGTRSGGFRWADV